MVSLLPLQFKLTTTDKFKVITITDVQQQQQQHYFVSIDYNCRYTENIIVSAIEKRPWCQIIDNNNNNNIDNNSLNDNNDNKPCDEVVMIQIKDFENINWDNVLNNNNNSCCSSYLVRKGISRKAQLSNQMKRFVCKHSESVLKNCIPFTIVVETWNAFENNMKVEVGFGTFAVFDSLLLLHTSLRQKLEWCLVDVKQIVEDEKYSSWVWILKPSIANKGVDISVLKSWDKILDVLESTPDMREWVLQKYITNPLLFDGYKFHLRVYVLCVGALRVFVYNNILMLLAAHRYEPDDLDDIYKHLTNTARSSETINFDENLFVKV